MAALDFKEAWRLIPPEEKFQIINEAHTQGVLALIGWVTIGSAVAIGLQIPQLFWISLCSSPLLFQFFSGKAWRNLKPRIVLEYLAARSASRRFAYSLKTKDLNPVLIFRGEAREVQENQALQSLEEAIGSIRGAEVWISLFNDALILIAEMPGGAELRFAAMLDDSLEIKAESPSGQGDYASDKEITLTTEKRGMRSSIKVTSRFPGALVVFEKKMQTLRELRKREMEAEAEEFKKMFDPAAEAADDFLNLLDE